LRRAADEARFDLALTRDCKEAAAILPSLWRCLRNDASWDVIELAKVPESGAICHLMAEAEKDGSITGFQRCFRTPIVSLTGLPDTGEDPWLGRTSHSFRHELRRKTRRLQDQGNLRLKRFDGTTPEVLEQFYELERATWKGEQGCAVVSDGRRLRYYNAILGELERLGYLTIFFLTLGDRLVAALVCFTSGRKLFALRCAFDLDFGAYSPGHIVINWALRDCAREGFRNFI
jgi:hypothetical protein